MNDIIPHTASLGAKIAERSSSGNSVGEQTEALSQNTGNTLPASQGIRTATAVQGNEANTRQLENAVARLNDYIQSIQRDLEFSLDESSGRSVISVIDRSSDEVVRQIPSEVTLQLAQKLNNEEPLLLFSAQV